MYRYKVMRYIVSVLLVPEGRRLGILMSFVIVVITCVGGKEEKRGQWGLGKGTKNGAIDTEQGASKGTGLQLHTKSNHSKNESYSYIKLS